MFLPVFSLQTETESRSHWPLSQAPFVLTLLSVCIFLSGCAVPLGAGFRLNSRQLSVPNLPGTTGPLHLRISDRMKNDGNRALNYLEVSAPIAPARTNLS